MWQVLEQREKSIHQTGSGPFAMACEQPSLAGSVSQRACNFCGSRVVLYPIADALHLVHGPIGCAAYTWDIRGALSSGPQLHRLSFSTDLREKDVIYGGEKKLYAALSELIEMHAPKAAFVYSTCIVGLIGDDVDAICRRVSAERGIPVIPVQSEGFKGSKKKGYSAACDAIFSLVKLGTNDEVIPKSINILGDYNLAGEIWMIRKYYEEMGVRVIATITGDGRVEDIKNARRAALNVVQCSGSVTSLAKRMKDEYGTPFKQVSYFGLEDMSNALYEVAKTFEDNEMLERARALVRREIGAIMPELERVRPRLAGKKAAIYVGGAFKAFSLVRALRVIGMQTALAGSQTGSPEDYAMLRDLCDPGTILVDDTNPLELAKFIIEKDIDLLIGGVKERPIAYKLGVAFCDHNHERKLALAGYQGMLNFAREVAGSVLSPVWQFVPRRQSRVLADSKANPPRIPGDPALPAA